MDVNAYYRLVGSIDATLESLPNGANDDRLNAEALVERYQASWEAARAIIPDDDYREMIEICGEWTEYPASGLPADMVEYGRKARARLAALAGWLKGYITASQAQLEAQAYAEARLAQENAGNIGFGE